MAHAQAQTIPAGDCQALLGAALRLKLHVCGGGITLPRGNPRQHMEETVVKWSLSQGAIWTFRVVEGKVHLDEKPRNKRTSENAVLWVPREFAT